MFPVLRLVIRLLFCLFLSQSSCVFPSIYLFLSYFSISFLIFVVLFYFRIGGHTLFLCSYLALQQRETTPRQQPKE